MILRLILLVPCVWFLILDEARATEFTSANFRVLDPVMHSASSPQMSSPNFRLIGTVGQVAIGTSSSPSSLYKVASGFLYFPGPVDLIAVGTAPAPASSIVIVGGEGGKLFERLLLKGEIPPPCAPPDLSCNGRVDLVDMSIFLHLLLRGETNIVDFNHDQKVDLADVSVLFFAWNQPRDIFQGLEKEKSISPSLYARRISRKQFASAAQNVKLEELSSAKKPFPAVEVTIRRFIKNIWTKSIHIMR